VAQGATANPLYDAFLKAGEEAGQGRSDDLNGYRPEGVARLDRTTAPGGTRSSAASAHLVPALARENVALATGARVDRVLLEAGAAAGVEFEGGATVAAKKEVILSAGAVKTPQLLNLSGIGDRARLDALGIDCARHLPGVGRNLMDHACINTAFRCATDDSLEHFGRLMPRAAVGAEWLLTGGGWAASNVWEAGGLVFGSDEHRYPNLQYHFAPVYAQYRGGTSMDLISGFQIQVDQLRPHSRGEVALTSRDPAAAPAVTFNYLTDPRDARELVEGYRRAQELLLAPALQPFRADLALPTAPLLNDSAIELFVRTTSGTDYHPCGTAKMGVGEDAVVDAECRVHGVDRLRVVDASVFPEIPSGNLNAPTQMTARKAADAIRGIEPLPRERPRFHFDDECDDKRLAA